MNQEDIMVSWNPSMHADLQETIKLWEIVHSLKEHGSGELNLIIRDGVIVSAETKRKWVNKGNDFNNCML